MSDHKEHDKKDRVKTVQFAERDLLALMSAIIYSRDNSLTNAGAAVAPAEIILQEIDKRKK
jgi:hypothetical protein